MDSPAPLVPVRYRRQGIAAQLLGLILAAAGAFMMLGLAATLLAGGVIVAVWGTLREAGRL